MAEKIQSTPETTTNMPTPEAILDKKPGFFGRAFRKITNGITSLVRGVDTVVSHIPVVGEVYSVAKGVVRQTWRATEHVPFLRDVNTGIRKQARTIHEKTGFTQAEKKEISTEEDALTSGLQEVRNNIARDMPESQIKRDVIACYDEFISDPSPEKARRLLADMSQKYPELKPILEKYFQGDEKNKTGKENMTVSQLMEEGKQLEQKMMDIVDKEKDAKGKQEIKEDEFGLFKKEFPALPEFTSIDKNSPLYKFLQNSYFSRDPHPDLKNPLVNEFIGKTLTLLGASSSDKTPAQFKERSAFVVLNKEALVDAFGLSEFEQNYLERSLNYNERRRRTTLVPEGYSGPTYGVDSFESTLYEKMFSQSGDSAMDDFGKKLDTYQGTFLDFFVGGGH